MNSRGRPSKSDEKRAQLTAIVATLYEHGEPLNVSKLRQIYRRTHGKGVGFYAVKSLIAELLARNVIAIFPAEHNGNRPGTFPVAFEYRFLSPLFWRELPPNYVPPKRPAAAALSVQKRIGALTEKLEHLESTFIEQTAATNQALKSIRKALTEIQDNGRINHEKETNGHESNEVDRQPTTEATPHSERNPAADAPQSFQGIQGTDHASSDQSEGEVGLFRLPDGFRATGTSSDC